MTTRSHRFGTLLVCAGFVGACSQLIGLSDYDKTDGNTGEGGESSGAKGGKGGTGQGGAVAGTGPSAGGSMAGAGGGTGGTAGRGGTGGKGGGDLGGDAGNDSGGAPDRGGTGGKGGKGGSGGDAGAGMAGVGGETNYDCVSTLEITTAEHLHRSHDPILDNPAIYNSFVFNPQIGAAGPDEIWIDFYDDATGIFDLAAYPDDNYQTCVRCVWGGEDVNTANGAQFYVKSGTITIDASSKQEEGFPKFELDDVTLIESTVDVQSGGSGTLLSKPVANPRCLHLAHAVLDLPEPPSTWKCDPESYSWGDSCECGCGAQDPDCATQYSGACDSCGDDGSCATDDACTGINPDDNGVCTVSPPAWLCSPKSYGDSQSCDCGCGAVDPDCVSPDGTACDACTETLSCDPAHDCAKIDPADNSKCVP